MRLPSISRLGLAAAAVIIVCAVSMQAVFPLGDPEPITEKQARAFLFALRDGMNRGGGLVLPETLDDLPENPTPIVLTVWSGGTRKHVFQVDGLPPKQAVEQLNKEIWGLSETTDDPRLKLQLDFVVAEGWIPSSGLFAVLSFVEGRDGISGTLDGKRVYLPPSELIRNNKYGSFKPLPDYDSKFRVGIDMERVKKTIRHQGKRVGIRGKEVTDLARFRSLTVVEGYDLKPRVLLKGTVERPPLTRSRVHASVMAGARYLVDALGGSGIYHYYYNPVRDRDEIGEYNWPRHAGVSYSLALVGRLLKRPDFVATAKRALERFELQLIHGPDDSRCLMSRGKCYLGSSALGLLALAEYRIASNDDRFDDTARMIARFLSYMQKEDGLFYHDWYPQTDIDKKLEKLYASQQAVFALARYAKALGEPDALDAAVRGMDYLAGPYWNHFLGSFFFGQEHWTCLAAEEVYDARPKSEYAKLCYGIGVHYDNITHKPGETPYLEDVGGMSITHIFTPHLGGTATAAEAMVSAVRLGQEIGLDTRSIQEQLRATFGFLVRGQVTVHDTFWMRRPKLAVGGFFETQTKPKIRIDNVQHAISAMARGLDVFPKASPEAHLEAANDYEL